MESINFNDFTLKERNAIIKDFLVKMRKVDSMSSAQSFFEHYLRKFYKLPSKLVNDIVYCQKAMKTHLLMHQVSDPVIKNKYLHELEDMLYELNAECQYLMLCLRDDIDRFCSAFTEQNLRPNEQVVKDIVSEAIVPLVLDPLLSIYPNYIAQRPSEAELLSKYFTIESTEPDKEMVTLPKEPPQLPPSADTPTVVKESRLNLQAALKRARSQSKQNEKSDKSQPDDKLDPGKELFMQSVGLYTHLEHKKLIQSRAQLQKRKSKPTEKAKKSPQN
ncbi:hypothetical protein KR009_009327 [Drosophila setifemur]|nr:hypothetical protein KR009_009327 [Drosophila setifemur]